MTFTDAETAFGKIQISTISTAFRPHSDHISTTFRPHFDHIPTTFGKNKCLSTVFDEKISVSIFPGSHKHLFFTKNRKCGRNVVEMWSECGRPSFLAFWGKRVSTTFRPHSDHIWKNPDLDDLDHIWRKLHQHRPQTVGYTLGHTVSCVCSRSMPQMCDASVVSLSF